MFVWNIISQEMEHKQLKENIFQTTEVQNIRANFLNVCCGKFFQRLTVLGCCHQEVMR